MEMFIVAIVILAALAISDLVVGVSNDAVNFLNSSIGSRVTTRKVIMVIASLGMLAGVMFSRGMMEVARKSIFNPQQFTMPELMTIFLAVMLTDVLLLDFYNTFGLPTSTTVSIVFELLGAAVAVSMVKISRVATETETLSGYINTGKALVIISGILLSVVVAFLCGMIIQFISRLIFTFDIRKRLKRYGALWGGLALSSILYFIVIKGAKGSTFITKDMFKWLTENTLLIVGGCFAVCAVILQVIMWVSRINILKPIVLIGTFALAMAFAANDLVNFIGVPLAGMSAYKAAGDAAAATGGDPLTATMEALAGKTPSHTLLLLIAGIIMAVTLWVSKKARTVTATEINLSRQEEGFERFGSSYLARVVVRQWTRTGQKIKKFLPDAILYRINKRFDQTGYDKNAAADTVDGEKPSFDLVRASVNLMVASAIISFATSKKLPLSTTYVTFMVAMGSSFADRAWGRDSAVFRVTGVLTVIGGWFLTAFSAFTVAFLFALAIIYLKAPAVIGILVFGLIIILRNRTVHKKREKDVKEYDIFNLKKVKDGNYAIKTTFEHAGIFLKEIAKSLRTGYEGMVKPDLAKLRSERKNTRKIQTWANIIVANVFKTLRLLQREEKATSQKYAQTVTALQEIAECHRDVIIRAYQHVDNNHKGMLPVQLEELEKVKDCVIKVLEMTSDALLKEEIPDFKVIEEHNRQLMEMLADYDKNQVDRIQDDSSKTRLSILFYGFTRALRMIVEHSAELLQIFKESFACNKNPDCEGK